MGSVFFFWGGGGRGGGRSLVANQTADAAGPGIESAQKIQEERQSQSLGQKQSLTGQKQSLSVFWQQS